MTIIDPPSGWRYGFPKPIPEDRKKDTAVWLVEQGYPQKLIDEYGEFFMCRYWDEPDHDTVVHDKEQTALDWYYEQTVVQGKTNYAELLEQAKDIGRWQIEKAYMSGYIDKSILNKSKSKTYYQETYDN